MKIVQNFHLRFQKYFHHRCLQAALMLVTWCRWQFLNVGDRIKLLMSNFEAIFKNRTGKRVSPTFLSPNFLTVTDFTFGMEGPQVEYHSLQQIEQLLQGCWIEEFGHFDIQWSFEKLQKASKIYKNSFSQEIKYFCWILNKVNSIIEFQYPAW